LCLFEGTSISVGRGTSEPFEKYGHPAYSDSSYSFVPVSIVGKSTNPPYKDIKCFGKNLSNNTLEDAREIRKFKLTYLMDARLNTETDNFFSHPSFFNLLAGNSTLLQQIKSGLSEKEIQQSWEKNLFEFEKIRLNYLMYTESK
jgi:uncharacterized protein YbbC (DUF1343 family)